MVESEKRLIEALSSSRHQNDGELALLAAENGLPPHVVARVAGGVGNNSLSLSGALVRLLREGLARARRGFRSLAHQPRAVWLLTSAPAGVLGIVSQLMLWSSRSAQDAGTPGIVRALGEGLFAASWNWLFAGVIVQLILFSSGRSVRAALLCSASLFVNSIIVFGGWHRGILIQDLVGAALYCGLSAALYWAVLESVAFCAQLLCESPWRLERSRRRGLREYVEIATSEQRERRFLHPMAFALVKHARVSLFVCLATVIALLGAVLSSSLGSSHGSWTFLWIAGTALMGVTFSSLWVALAVASVTFFALFAYSFATYPFPQTVFMAVFQLVLAPVAMVGLAAGAQLASTKTIRLLASTLIRRGFYDVALLGIVRARRSLRAVSRPAFVVVVDAAKSTDMKANSDPLTAEHAFRMFQETIRTTADKNRGRVLATLGDGAIVILQNASDALGFARELLQEVERLNAESNPLDRPFLLRIGVHYGVSQGDILETEYSHVVDVASHIQSHAPLGGILVSESVVLAAPDLHAVPTEAQTDGYRLYELV